MAEETVKFSAQPVQDNAVDDAYPNIQELQTLLDSCRTFSHHVDEVWPNLYLGDLVFANNRYELWKLGITHVLNAAHGTWTSQGNSDFYGATITYHGIPANDLPDFDMSKYFYSASEFIHKALNIDGARLLVHCVVGISRSATLVLAYLMIHQHLSLKEAIQKVQEKRWISPNAGFLRQLLNLDKELKHGNGQCGEPKMKRLCRDPSTVHELEALLENYTGDVHHVDQVFPNLYLGDIVIASDKNKLKKIGITHILNAAHSSWECKDNIEYGPDIEYYGITAEDCPDFDISVYLRPGAEFINKALNTPNGKVLVHCVLGKSRSATLVLAYLMIYQHFSLPEAIRHVSNHRCIAPNRGFLEQLQQLERQLKRRILGCWVI
ncbi:dual specificity protein phosphatase 13 [Bombina bombina]|uniref:dual specificity protein phosphatase 13 n=1 Tax=Bombina bombina TaxID=8345 RepID=UPI00235B274C|nr:dual specificity protein phosphatase 13 [Bombina bombina]